MRTSLLLKYKSLRAFHIYREERSKPCFLTSSQLEDLLRAAITLDGERHFASRENKAAYTQAGDEPQGGLKYEPMTPMLLLAVLTGCRRGEVVRLRWENVDWCRKLIRIKSDPSDDWKVKTRSERDLRFGDSPALEHLLLVLKLQKGESPYILRGARESKPKNWHSDAWKRLCEHADQEGRVFGDLRSTFASALSLWQREGRRMPLSEVAAWLGHSLTVAERHYYAGARATQGDTLEAMLGIAGEFDAAINVIGQRHSNAERLAKRA